ncbi:MAG: dual specificity protein phosphatase family protein [Phycisphaeraceae bacterium]|nr:dual specificity protein phosphatase family protein [Phycisphaeraceae bacterium]
MNITWKHVSVPAFAAALLGCQSAPRTVDIPWDGPGTDGALASAPTGAPEQVKDVEGVDNCYLDGPVCIASQPSAEALRGFADDGVTVVINLRTDREMDELGYDEAALCAEAGLDYVRIPLGGKEPGYKPEALAEFSDVMRRHNGKALIHCASGGRATHMYVAYLIHDRGYSLQDAYDVGLKLRYQPLPLEQLLDRKIGYHFED